MIIKFKRKNNPNNSLKKKNNPNNRLKIKKTKNMLNLQNKKFKNIKTLSLQI